MISNAARGPLPIASLDLTEAAFSMPAGDCLSDTLSSFKGSSN